jgi:tungstate transport system substrate-binding protein
MIRTILLALSLFIQQANAEKEFITVASTTSTRDSGLFETILPLFSKSSGIEVRVVAVGTGQAIMLSKNGDADVLLVHHRKSEEAFVKEGFGVKRYDVMYNDFVIVGPAHDPAATSQTENVIQALTRIATAKTTFLSRGDNSGTNKKERALWNAAGIDTNTASGDWYREIGSGMGATLNTAAAMNGYCITDRGTWLGFQNRGDLKILFEGGTRLLNPYGVILVSPERHPHTKEKAGQMFIEWLISAAGQEAIASFKINGAKLFNPNAQ